MKNTAYTNDPYFQITERELRISGLEKELTILHISDMHIIVSEEGSTDSYKEHAAKAKKNWEGLRLYFAKCFGDDRGEEHLLPPEEGLAKFVQLANEKRPDALLMTGDMMNDYSDENMRFLASLVDRVEVPCMWVRGNHELGHDQAFAPYTQDGALVQSLQIGNLKLLGLDNSRRKVSAEQTSALKEAVNAAKAEGCVPILTMHMPVQTPHNVEQTNCFESYYLVGGEETDEESFAFLDYLQSEECPIAALLCGHVHGHHISYYAPEKPMICSSSAMVGSCALLRFIPS